MVSKKGGWGAPRARPRLRPLVRLLCAERQELGRLPQTVKRHTDAEREPDNETPAEKSTVTLNYEAMLAALNGLLAEMREERRQAEASGSFADAQHGQEPATVQPNAWVEAHAMLSKK